LIELEQIIETLGGRQSLELALSKNINWITDSFTINQNNGSSASRNLLGKWTKPYLETTGYLLPTLLKAKTLDRKLRHELVLQQYLFFKDQVNDDGSFYQSLDNKTPIVFDTSQILLGLISVIPLISVTSQDIINLCEGAYKWLYNNLDDQGKFKAYNYVEGYNPAYYARVALPMVQWEIIFGKKLRPKTEILLSRLNKLRTENLSYKNWGFYADTKAYTHTIAYTLRGLYECADLVGTTTTKEEIKMTLLKINAEIEKKGKLAGSYDTNWQGDYSFVCATGNAQLALLYLLVYKTTRDAKFLQSITTLLLPLVEAQKSWYSRGAVPSSIPIWGPYQRLKYTNWTQKFYSEALNQLLSLV